MRDCFKVSGVQDEISALPCPSGIWHIANRREYANEAALLYTKNFGGSLADANSI
jgi:hypothetical protein